MRKNKATHFCSRKVLDGTAEAKLGRNEATRAAAAVGTGTIGRGKVSIDSSFELRVKHSSSVLGFGRAHNSNKLIIVKSI